MQISILGGGIAGVSAAYHAKKLGQDATIYEARSHLGGLIDNFTVEEFRFDNAIHLSFTKDSYVRSIFDKTEYIAHPPTAYCYDEGYWMKHPVQNNLYPLPVDVRVELLASFMKRSNDPVTNYREWLISQYGEGIAKRYPLPYTEKYWTVPAEMLGLDWIANRMRRADESELLWGALSHETPNTYYASEMRYPVKGGYRAFLDPILEGLNMQCNKTVLEIDLQQKQLLFSDESVVYYEKLISTLPLPNMVQICKDVPKDVKNAANTLWATSVDLVSFGFNRPDVPPYLWLYIYNEDMLPARGYSPSWKSSDNAPQGMSSLQFEIYSSRHKSIGMSRDNLTEHVAESLSKMGLAEKNEVLFAHHKKIEFANVAFDLGMEVRRDYVKEYLKSEGVLLAGRFGEWDYFWSDQSFMSGKHAVDACKTTSKRV